MMLCKVGLSVGDNRYGITFPLGVFLESMMPQTDKRSGFWNFLMVLLEIDVRDIV